MGELDPISVIEYFRFGLEKFSASRGGALSGVNPIVTDSLSFECQKEALGVKVIAEGLKEKTAIPFGDGGLFQKVSKIIFQIVSVDLLADFRSQMK